MARKRSSASNKVVDDTFAAALEEARRAFGPSGLYVGEDASRAVIGLPLETLAQRWLVQCSCLPLGRIMHVYGPPDSLKTTFSFEVMRWHLQMPNAGAFYFLTEASDQPALRRRVLGSAVERVARPLACRTLQEWQDAFNKVMAVFNSRYSKPGDCSYPVCLVVDSLIGVTNEEMVNQVVKEGHASLAHPHDANLLNTFFKVAPSMIMEWPFTWIITNHMKRKQSAGPGSFIPEWKTPGGVAPRYYATIEVRMASPKSKAERRASGSVRQVVFRVEKNKLGDSQHVLPVNVWYDHDQDGQPRTWFDWAEASVTVLDTLPGVKSKESWYRRIHEVLDFEVADRTKRVTSSSLGIKNASAEEFCQALAEAPEISRALDRVLGIETVTPFRPGVPYRTQIEEAVSGGGDE